MLHVALEIPLGLLLVRRRPQGDHAAAPWIHRLGEAFDRTAFSRRIPSFKQDDHAESGGFHPVLHLDQLRLQPRQFLFVTLFFQAFVVAGKPLLQLHQDLLRVIDVTIAVVQSIEHRSHVVLVVLAHRA